MVIRPQGVSCSVWQEDVCCGSCGSCMRWGRRHGSNLFQHIPQVLDRIGIWGNLQAKSTPWVISLFLKSFLKSTDMMGGPLPSESAVAMGRRTWSITVFGWVVCVKWHPHEWIPGPEVLSVSLSTDVFTCVLIKSSGCSEVVACCFRCVAG